MCSRGPGTQVFDTITPKHFGWIYRDSVLVSQAVDDDIYSEGIPAGRASPNESIYIIDEQMHLLPPDFPGEITIGGITVAVGYLINEA